MSLRCPICDTSFLRPGGSRAELHDCNTFTEGSLLRMRLLFALLRAPGPLTHDSLELDLYGYLRMGNRLNALISGLRRALREEGMPYEVEHLSGPGGGYVLKYTGGNK